MSDSDEERPRAPACDNCRNRKVKCDRQIPCANCRGWRTKCTTTVKAREKKKRIVISQQYETEFKELNQKLESLAVTLQTIVDTKSSSVSPASHVLQQQVGDLLATVKQEDDDEQPFEGASMFHDHLQEVAHVFGGNSTLPGQRKQHESLPTPEFSPAPIENFTDIAKLPLPPASSALAVLRYAKTTQLRYFQSVPIVTEDEVFELCQKLYFPTEPYSLTTFLLANSSLLYIFYDMSRIPIEHHGISCEDCLAYSQMCRDNLTAAIKCWPISMSPSFQNIRTLASCLFPLVEAGNMVLLWHVVTIAARLCCSAGIHQQNVRPSNLSEAQKRAHRWVFWTIYSVDHALSLNLMQPSNLPDWDMTIDIPTDPDPLWSQHWIWTKLAHVQGQVYENLYSPKARKSGTQSREQEAGRLAQEMLKIQELFEPGHVQTFPVRFQGAATATVEFMIFSTLTLIYKVVSATWMTAVPEPIRYSMECIEAARSTLSSLNKAWEEISNDQDDYFKLFLNWTIMGCPFVAFIVVSGNAMMGIRPDFELLSRTMETLHGVHSRSPGIVRVVNACQHFYQMVSVLYSQQTQILSQPQTTSQTSVPKTQVQDMPLIQPTIETTVTYPNYMDLADQDGEWDRMLTDWELGVGAEDARQMTSYFEQHQTISPFGGDMG